MICNDCKRKGGRKFYFKHDPNCENYGKEVISV